MGTHQQRGYSSTFDNGIRVAYATYGEKEKYDGNGVSLPYGHEFRLLHNRKKETGVYNKVTRDKAIAKALCGYNHIPEEEYVACMGKLKTVKDSQIGISYTTAAQAVLNLIPLEILEKELSKFTNQEYLSIGNHEQYYYAYQPDYAEKFYTMGRIMKENGFEFIFAEELPH